VENPKNLSNIRVTIDRENDLTVVRNIVSKIRNRPILMSDILNLYQNEPKLFALNQSYDVNEGYLKSLNEDKEFLKSQDK
jgi:spore coat polysaccharide biosynthesis protein SpsF (cytidylyltransferase family)